MPWACPWPGFRLRVADIIAAVASLRVADALSHQLVGRPDGRLEQRSRGRNIALSTSTIQSMALLGESFFVAVIGTQLTLVFLAAPAATAGAICQDRARGTLTHMLMTDLTNREIVVGKLAARLAPVLSLIACTLPVLELLTLLGGVDPDALLGAFAVTLGLAVLGSSLALVFSLWAGKTHEALLGTYAVWGLWLLGRPMLIELGRAFGWNLPAPAAIGRSLPSGVCTVLGRGAWAGRIMRGFSGSRPLCRFCSSAWPSCGFGRSARATSSPGDHPEFAMMGMSGSRIPGAFCRALGSISIRCSGANGIARGRRGWGASSWRFISRWQGSSASE